MLSCGCTIRENKGFSSVWECTFTPTEKVWAHRSANRFTLMCVWNKIGNLWPNNRFRYNSEQWMVVKTITNNYCFDVNNYTGLVENLPVQWIDTKLNWYKRVTFWRRDLVLQWTWLVGWIKHYFLSLDIEKFEVDMLIKHACKFSLTHISDFMQHPK